jgi:hypothetical protein
MCKCLNKHPTAEICVFKFPARCKCRPVNQSRRKKDGGRDRWVYSSRSTAATAEMISISLSLRFKI